MNTEGRFNRGADTLFGGQGDDLLARLAQDAAGNAILDLGLGNTVTLAGSLPGSVAADWFPVA
ncbi:MAG TPA: hypothetical protein VIR38_13780 [Thalassobaculum sp.]